MTEGRQQIRTAILSRKNQRETDGNFSLSLVNYFISNIGKSISEDV